MTDATSIVAATYASRRAGNVSLRFDPPLSRAGVRMASGGERGDRSESHPGRASEECAKKR